MKSLPIEFAAKRRVASWLLVSLSLALLLAAAQLGMQVWELRSMRLVLQTKLVQSQERLRDLQQKIDAETALRSVRPPYYDDAMAVVKTASFPWQQVFAALEGSRVQGVRVVSVEIDASSGAVKVELEGATQESLMQYLEEINAGEIQGRWALVQTQAGSVSGSAAVATISSLWR